MKSLRIVGRVAAIVLLFLACLPLHLGSRFLFRRSLWPRRFLGGVAWIVGARVRREGDPPRPHSLLVCNHVSWLDILVVSGATGCAFVSKDSLGHGFIHWLADQNGTIYVRRAHRKGAKEQAATIARALSGDQPIALFPEGTTGPGTHLLPFRSTLLEAVSGAGREIQVRPVAIDYGAAAPEVGWFHESGRDNVLRILGRKGTLPVTVRLLAPLPRADRKTLTAAARDSIEAALAASSSARPAL